MTASFLQDGDLTLRPMRDADEDYALMQRWLSDERVLEWYVGRDTRATMEWVRDEYEDMARGEDPATPCIIELGGAPIGYLQFYPHDAAALSSFGLPEKETAYGIDLFIGEPARWSQGTGSRLLRATLRYLFAVRGATLVTIDPRVENARAIRAYEKAGFRPFKVLPASELHEGTYRDCLLMTAAPSSYPNGT
jgi:aminoglycoside 6'-N-acetyltransferase